MRTVKNIAGNEKKHKHELIPEFTLDKFNAADWATLFKRAGAKFVGPVAWHGSGFLHWDSDITEFDAVDMGPGIDLLGELKKEIYAREMKFITSFHTGYWYHAAIDREKPGTIQKGNSMRYTLKKIFGLPKTEMYCMQYV